MSEIQNIKELKKELAPTKQVINVDTQENNELSYMMEFVPPAEGTPAAEALQANAEVKISRLAKGIRKIGGIKHPKLKNVTKGWKRKKKQEKFSRNFKGKVINGVHELYTLTAGMMLGMRCAIGRANPTSIPQLTLGDFSYVEKISFPPSGNSHGPFRTPPHNLAHTFKFKTYAPLVFSRIRDFFGVDSMSYMLSVCGNYNYLEFLSNSKSGQFFFYSHDGRYMIKTQTNEENKFMKRILPHYYRYVTEHPHTFLVRIYGMHRVKMYHLHRKVHFVIMASVFDTPAKIGKIYDLKGSRVGRTAEPTEGVLKDNNLVADGVKLKLGSKRELFLHQLEKDATFLSQLNIMDYSLLVGIHKRSDRDSQEIKPVPSTTAEETLAVIPSSAPQLSYAHSNTPFRQKDPSRNLLTLEKGSSNTVTSPPADVNALPSNNPTLRPRGKSISGTRKPRRSIPGANSPMKVNGVVQLELTEDQLREERELSYETHSDISEAEGIMEGTDDGEEYYDEEEEDEGDSDVEFDEEVLKKFYSTSGTDWNQGSTIKGTNLASLFTGGEDGDEKAENEEKDGQKTPNGAAAAGDDDENVMTHYPEKNVSMAGLGLSGEEGKQIRALINPRQDLTQMSRDAEKELQTEKRLTFGPGAAQYHPWTSRVDGGINARLSNEKRGDEIYFIGIIDILQQYNASKQFETIFKSFTHDVSQISSVDSVSYAKRFVAFLRENTC